VGFATVHRENENLWPGVFAGAFYGDKSQTVAGGRPARRADTLTFVGQRVLRSSGDINEDELAIAAVLLEIWAGDDENDGLAVGGN
jgi:hypothetical protein